ncbi:unnamed protein product [Leptosia nina]|uniref:Uncharacterized protein n=1 Tax=Leptosia nina TaxID=320188 RepID=A0AAV1IZW0_9NEOP
MDPFARLMEGTPLPGVLPTRDARPRGALVHASLAAAPHLGDKKGRHLTGTFCLTGDTMEGIIQCLVFLKAFSHSSIGTRKFSEECRPVYDPLIHDSLLALLQTALITEMLKLVPRLDP